MFTVATHLYSGLLEQEAVVSACSTGLCIDNDFINPWRACARVTLVVLSVWLLSHISPLERLFVLKILSRTQRATEVKKFVGFSLKQLRSKVMASFAYP